MSIRRMMLFTLGAKIKNLIDAFKTRVLATQGEFEAESCLEAQLTQLDNQSLLDNASLVVTPNGYKETLLYAVEPNEVGTNLLQQSENFTVLPWIFLASPNVTRTANAGTSPTGTNNATLLTSNSNTQDIGIRQNVPIILNTQYVFSLWARSDNGAQIRLDIGDVNVTTFTLTNTWQRIQVVATPTVNNWIDIQFAANQLGKTCLIWGAQLVPGSTITNYISTTDRAIINGTIGDMSVTRATTATRVNADGFIEEVPYNLLSQSQNFENGFWNKQRTTIGQNVILAPDGTLTADNLIANSGVTYDYIGVNGVNVVSSSFLLNTDQRTLSFYLKYNGLNRIRVIYGSATSLSGTVFVEVDLQLGIITTSNGGIVASNFFIEIAGNGWYRVGFNLITTLSTTNNRFAVGLGDTTKTIANGIDGVYLWGAQLVTGAQPKNYFPTTNRFNVPRIDYSNGSCPSILVEPQRTNLVVQNQNMTVSPWIYQNANGVSTNDLNPSGQNSSNRINLLLSGFSSVRQAIPSLNNTTYTISCFFKKIPGFDNSFEMRYTNELVAPNNFNAIAFINPNTKTATFSLSGTNGTGISGSITGKVDLYPNDWFRVSMTFTSGSAAANVNALFRPAILINSTASVLIWGAQLEVGPNATSYIPTVASTVTRNADVISNTNVSTLIGQTEGTIFVEFVPKVVNSDIIRMTENISTFNNGFFIFINTPGNLQCLIRANGVTSVNHVIPVNISNTPIYKVAIKYSSGNTKIFVNGILRITNTTVYTFSLPLTRIQMDNSQWTGNNQTRAITNVSLWKTQITDAQAIQLTTL
jgi:hypothetical protein